jgi:hypothetical protein
VLATHRGTADVAGTDWESAVFRKVKEEVKADWGLTVERMVKAVVFRDHHDNGCLLPTFSRRCQRMALAVRLAHWQILPPPVELMKLQLHGLATESEYAGGWIWSFAVWIISAPITPMKLAPCGPNWSFAKFQGSWSRGAGIPDSRRLAAGLPLADSAGTTGYKWCTVSSGLLAS